MKRKKKLWFRTTLQLFFFILIAFISINHTLVENGGGIKFLSSASLHSVCPFGGVTTIYQLITAGTLVKQIHESALVLMVISGVLAVGFGAIFCGWICPLGSIQEWTGKIGRKLFKSKYNAFIPYKYDKYLRFLRYGVLAWVIYLTAVTGKIVFSDVDPYYALFNFWSSEIALGGIIVLVITLISSLFVERPWCKYACPFGAVLGLSNFIRLFKIRREPSSCISCKACDRVCPMNIKVSDKSAVRDHQCISCMQCTSEQGCPVNNTVYICLKGGNKHEA